MTSSTLSARLRAATAAEHARAESTDWAAALAAGTAPRAAYAAYIEALEVVYRSLEASLSAAASDPAVSAVHDLRLERRERLVDDLAAWGTPLHLPAAQAAAAAYADRISTAAGLDPVLLVAHHYVRYLGDLSGGQVVAAAMTRRSGGDSVAGVSFYDFTSLLSPTSRGGSSLVPYVRGYRDALDGLALDEARTQAVAAEAVRSFQLTIDLFSALQPALQPVL